MFDYKVAGYESLHNRVTKTSNAILIEDQSSVKVNDLIYARPYMYDKEEDHGVSVPGLLKVIKVEDIAVTAINFIPLKDTWYNLGPLTETFYNDLGNELILPYGSMMINYYDKVDYDQLYHEYKKFVGGLIAYDELSNPRTDKHTG